MLAVPAFAEHRENTDVLDADSAIEAALNWSDFAFDTSNAVIIGRDDVFADNLASGVIQGLGDGVPLLLTKTDDLVDTVAAEIQDLGATVAHILGGEEAINADVEDELEALGLTIHRHAGATRVETAIDIASKHATDATSAIVARAYGSENDESQAFADSLAAGAWAAESGMPVLLTQTAELNDNLRTYLEGSDITEIFVVGGTSAISAAVVAELEAMGIEVTRVSGATRFETAVAIAEARGFTSAADADTVILAEGQQANAWAGGFAAAAYSALTGAPVVLSNGADLPAPTVDFLEGGTAALVCGPFVEPAACDEAAEILGHQPAPHTNQTLAVTPQDAAENTVATEPSTDDDRQYSVSGLTDGTEYDVVLFPAENVSTDADGIVTFTDAENSNVGDNESDGGGTTGAIIEVINGASYAGGDTAEVNPVNGTITFTVEYDGTASEEIVPVIFVDTEDDGNVELNADNEPTEAFGIGGEKRWVPAEAAVGRIDADAAADEDEDIVAVDKDADRIVTDEATYFYDSNDVFYVSSTDSAQGTDNTDCGTVAAQRTLAQFEAEVSANDELDESTVYNPEPGLQSTFCLEDTAPVTPVATAGEAGEDSIEIDVTNRPTDAAVTVKIVADGAACTANAVTEETTSTDEDTSEANFQVLVDGLQSSTNYEACTKFVVDGEDSPWDGPDGFSTLAPGATARPQSDDAWIVNDINGEVSGEDTWRIIFNKQMSPVDNDDRIQVSDGQGELLNVYCGLTDDAGTNQDSEAVCQFNTGTETIGGTPYPAGRILTVDMSATAGEDYSADNTVTGGDGVVDYPATITAQTGFTDLNGNTWDLTASDDVVIDDEGAKAASPGTTLTGDSTGPVPASADFTDDSTDADTVMGDDLGDKVVLTYDEAVILEAGDTIVIDTDNDDAGTANVTYTCGTDVSCSGSGTTTITIVVTDATAAPDTDVTGDTLESDDFEDFDSNATADTADPAIT